ncbi:MAG: S8 family serine peptidase [Lachnospiraceae bacterium]|nr:S8 family serine peptidase [Lachnospiraceae bacterium]
MKKGWKKRLWAVLLAAALAVSQNGSVLAAQEGNEAAPLEMTLQQEASENGTGEETGIPASENGTGDAADIPASENGTAEDISGNDPAAAFKGMPEGFVLSESDVLGKKRIAENGVLEALNTLKPGVDYVEDEVIFSCGDPDYAKTVAEAYGGTLKSCELGVAVIKLDTEKTSVKDAVAAGASQSVALPPVDVNTISYLTDPVEATASVPEAEGFAGTALAKKKERIAGRDLAYWTMVKGFNDPGLDPSYVYPGNPRDEKEVSGYQWMHDAVESYRAWAVTRGQGVTVAVIDTGVHYGHEELDAKGKVDKSAYSDSVFKNSVDTEGHGTHVAGIIAAEAGNGYGGAGIAPEAKILAIPIFNEKGTYDIATLVRGINYVTNGGTPRAQVINMSLGGVIFNNAEQEAITAAHDAGITVCVSMGNDTSNCLKYPASYDNVVAVSALDESWQKSDFSTSGSWADVGAPGTAIFSTWNGHDDDNSVNDYNYYASWNGTSMATPVVAGICALYISAKGGKADPDEVEEALKKTAVKVSSPYQIGAGMVNAANMLALLEDTGAPSIQAPETLTKDGSIVFSDKNAAGKTLGFVYTVNGKKPRVKDGEIREGFFIGTTEETPGECSITAEDLVNHGAKADETVKLQALRITGIGTATEIAEKTLQIPSSAIGYRVEGPALAAKGKSVAYTLSPSFGKGKVTWSLEGDPAGVTVNKKTGKVSIKKTASGEFTVVGEAEGRQGKLKVKIIEPAADLTLTLASMNQQVNDIRSDRKANILSARIYTVDIRSTEKFNENVLSLVGKADNNSELYFKSSNPAVASVDASGKVTGINAGTAKITCGTTDGSGKKKTITIRVIVPAARLDMIPKGVQQAVGFGKKMKLRPIIGAAYGQPTVKKVEWETEPVKVISYTSLIGQDVTAQAKEYIKIKNGTLSVDKKITKLNPHGHLKVTVRMKSTDGTGLQAEKEFLATNPATFMRRGYKSPQRLNAGGAYAVDNLFYGDLGMFYSTTSGGKVIEPEIVSSNPEVVSAKVYGYSMDYSKGMSYKCILTTKKRGSATVTIKATDGSGKKASIRFVVR